MLKSDLSLQSRRTLLKNTALLAMAPLALRSASLLAQGPASLEIAAAGSMRAMLEGPLKQAALKELGLVLHLHTGGADAVARSLVDGSLVADVFLPITAEPMRRVLQAGKAKAASSFASTEMVILYSPKSRFAAHFADAAAGRRQWWSVLGEPGLRFARSNPAEDPSGRSILFTLMLAAAKYNRPDLVEQVLGAPFNPEQVHLGTNVRAGLEDGTIDAAGGYRIGTRLGQIPYLTLPPDLNLSDPQVRAHHPELVLSLAEQTFHVEPLIFYAAVLETARARPDAQRFVDWLRSKPVAALLQAEGFALPPTTELR